MSKTDPNPRSGTDRPKITHSEGIAPAQVDQRPPSKAEPNHHINLSRSAGGVANTALTPWELTFEEMCSSLEKRPPAGDKDGSYFVRASLHDGFTTRADDNLGPANIIVLDADSQYDPATGEVTDGAPDPAQVHEVLVGLGLNHCLYTTWSHQQEGKGNRYRIVIPAVTHDKGDLTGVLEWIFHLLEEKGVFLVNVRENASWSQPWYLPRRTCTESDYLCLHHVTGHPLDVAVALAWHAARKPPVEVHELPTVQTSAHLRDPDSAFSRFNAEYNDPSWLLSFLQGHGYTLKEVSGVGESSSYRLLSPHSTSGSAGIVVFRGEDDAWRVYSHHGDKDPLSRAGSAVTICDAFDVFCILDHGGDEAIALNAWEKSFDIRPVVRITGGALPNNLTRTVGKLASLDPPRIFQRAHSLVRIAHFDQQAETEGCTIPAGTAHIVPLQKPFLNVILSEELRWEVYKKKSGWVQTNPCPNVMASLLEGFGLWTGIPPLLGISEVPILWSDGALQCEAGYDRETQLYIEGIHPGLETPDTITKEDAATAAQALLAPFREFPFVEPNLDQAVLLAYLFTLAIRPQLTAAPMFCISATTPGTGKGLLVEACNLLVRGRDAATMPPIQGRGGEEETRKRLTALLDQGISSLNLDNCTKAIGGESMNALLTATEWTDRVLGQSRTVTLPVRCTIAATGNNLSVRGDMTRRALGIQLDAGVERPELRQFKEKDLPRYVLRHRNQLLTHLFTVLKGYQQAGCPGQGDNPLGRFEPWTDRICGPIRWLGFPDPLASQERLRELDPEAEKFATLLETWWDHMPHGWHTAGDVLKAVEEPQSPGKDQAARDALKNAIHEAASDGRGSPNGKLFGWYLGHHAGQIVGDLRLERKPRTSKSKKPQQYRVINISKLDRK